jgi:hypothetical protein
MCVNRQVSMLNWVTDPQKRWQGEYTRNYWTSWRSKKHMRSIFVIIILLSSLAVGHSQTNSWGKRIVSNKEKPLASFLNPHISTLNVLIIDGKRFEHVRGVKQFYVPIPKINSIVFLVDEKDGSVTYHVLNMDTGEDISIHARGSVFGQSIGSSRTQDGIEDMKDADLVLSTRSGPNTITKTLIHLDLKRKVVVGETTLFYDHSGNVISERKASPPF